jgi:methyl-accepting chemotaxis protein
METAALRYPQAATFTLVQSVNLARMVDLKKSYEERRTYWSDSILPTELKTKLADDVLLKGDRFWTVLNGETVDALQLSDPSRIEAALGSLKDAFHRHEAAVTGLVGSSDTFLKSRERDAETTGAKLTSAAMVGSATSVLLFRWWARVFSPQDRKLERTTTNLSIGSALKRTA